MLCETSLLICCAADSSGAPQQTVTVTVPVTPLLTGNTIVDGVAASNFGDYLDLSAKDSEATRHVAGLSCFGSVQTAISF